MGTYIKCGIEKLKSYFQNPYFFQDLIDKGIIIEVKEPHGRLIDETKIEHVYGEVDYIKVSYTGDTSRVEFINGTDAPTVIEAEGIV